jgi:uncharacterized protein (DUF58 family)
MVQRNWQTDLDPKILLGLETWEIRARKIVDGYLAGLHRGSRKGFSVEFAEHRQYVAGDDPRHIDWKIYGKRDRLYVRQYEEEAQLQCLVAVDASRSMMYRSDESPCSKFDQSRLIAAALIWLVLSQGDAIALALFNETDLLSFVPPTSKGSARPHLWGALDAIPTAEPAAASRQPSSDGTGVLGEIAARLKRAGVVFVISDLIGDRDTLSLGLKRLVYGKHDVSVVQVLDPAEKTFPFSETTLFRGLEGEGSLLIQPGSLKQAYLKELEEHQNQLQSACRELGIDFASLETGDTLDKALHEVLAARR